MHMKARQPLKPNEREVPEWWLRRRSDRSHGLARSPYIGSSGHSAHVLPLYLCRASSAQWRFAQAGSGRLVAALWGSLLLE